jgi:hypothetical protein
VIKQNPVKLLLAALMVAMLSFGCAQEMSPSKQDASAKSQSQKQTVYKGPIVGKSNKAKTISIAVGKGAKAKTIMVRFDDQTKGLEFAKKGEAAILTWEQRGADKFATVVKPKLAKLPEGVTEVTVDEMFKLVSSKTVMTLVDARPKSRFDQAHLPGAISIPVPTLKEQKASVLPKDKNQLVVFYCGGYT